MVAAVMVWERRMSDAQREWRPDGQVFDDPITHVERCQGIAFTVQRLVYVRVRYVRVCACVCVCVCVFTSTHAQTFPSLHSTPVLPNAHTHTHTHTHTCLPPASNRPPRCRTHPPRLPSPSPRPCPRLPPHHAAPAPAPPPARGPLRRARPVCLRRAPGASGAAARAAPAPRRLQGHAGKDQGGGGGLSHARARARHNRFQIPRGRRYRRVKEEGKATGEAGARRQRRRQRGGPSQHLDLQLPVVQPHATRPLGSRTPPPPNLPPLRAPHPPPRRPPPAPVSCRQSRAPAARPRRPCPCCCRRRRRSRPARPLSRWLRRATAWPRRGRGSAAGPECPGVVGGRCRIRGWPRVRGARARAGAGEGKAHGSVYGRARCANAERRAVVRSPTIIHHTATQPTRHAPRNPLPLPHTS
mgnify:CR=1 FL=1